jgi:hypothetical protein
MKKNNLFKIIIALIIFVALSYGIYIINQKNLSYINISINPDVVLAVNDDMVVEQVIPVNEDADILTYDLNLAGKSAEDATEVLLDEALKTGYINEYSEENTVVVTATNENEDKRLKIQEKIVNKVNKHLQDKKVYAVVVSNGVTDAMKVSAEKYDISNGKMLLVSKAREVSSYTEEKLADMSIKEIQAVIKRSVNERHENLKESKQELKDKWQDKKKNLKETYKNEIEKIKEAALESSGVDTKTLTEDEKNNIIKEKLETKKEEIKETVEEVKEEIEDFTSDTTTSIKDAIQRVREQIQNKKD